MNANFNPLAALSSMSRRERLKAALLSAWFFLTITTLWLLKPVRTASLLTHLGAEELPYLRFGSVIAVGLVVVGYSHIVNLFSRLQVILGAISSFVLIILGFWASMYWGGDALGGQRWFVWAVFIMVEIYSTVMVAIFWTYTNDVVSRAEADKLYAPIGIGGILGGIAGGVITDALVHSVGPVHMLLACAGCLLIGGGIAWATESILKPPARVIASAGGPGASDALEGAREVVRDGYLMRIVGIVVAYEFAAAVTDFVINVIFERSFSTETEIAQMYGRLGWIVSGTALVSQILIVPVLLPRKRIALLVPPVAMALATVSLAALPVVSLAILLAASDRGLNYSLQQVTKETLYVPLSDAQRYKAKAFIDVFVDRAAKALSSVALLGLMPLVGLSVRAFLLLALASLLLWARFASALGHSYRQRVGSGEAGQDADGDAVKAVPQSAAEGE